MDLQEALTQISEIRQQMARSEVFRGYRSLTVGLSGVLGVIAALVQPYLVSSPLEQLEGYLGMWVMVAGISLLGSGVEILYRAHAAGAGLARQMTYTAIGQFLPSVLVGGLLTICIYRSAPSVAWMLPGLWSFVFSLGVFSSCRCLPRELVWAASYYLLSGCLCLIFGQGDWALSPWLMGLSFGGGQLLTAALLYWTLERPNAASS